MCSGLSALLAVCSQPTVRMTLLRIHLRAGPMYLDPAFQEAILLLQPLGQEPTRSIAPFIVCRAQAFSIPIPLQALRYHSQATATARRTHSSTFNSSAHRIAASL